MLTADCLDILIKIINFSVRFNKICVKSMFKRVLARSLAARIKRNASEIVKKPVSKNLIVEELNDRELLKVEGTDAVNFLQGLITNDMKHLTESRTPAMYAMFLNKSGRMLYDSIIYRGNTPNTFIIECDKHISNELQRHLCIYRVRRKLNINSMMDVYKPWIIFDPDSKVNTGAIAKRIGTDIIYAPDPRVPGLGWRLITDTKYSWNDLSKMLSIPGEIVVKAPTDEYNYRYHRYCFGIGEGVTELPPGKCIPLEMNGDYLHGISFQKGCYIGQELTARAHHTGVVRKRLMPLLLSCPAPINVNTIQTESFTNAGTLRGVCNNRALALLRIEKALKEPRLLIEGEPCFVEKPDWWPKELPNKAALSGKV